MAHPCKKVGNSAGKHSENYQCSNEAGQIVPFPKRTDYVTF
jgi:hypothetical protein